MQKVPPSPMQVPDVASPISDTDMMMAAAIESQQGGAKTILEHIGDVGLLEYAAQLISSGRNLGQRALYNTTRSGLFNPNTVPEGAYPYGGAGRSLKERREQSMSEAVSISNQFRVKK